MSDTQLKQRIRQLIPSNSFPGGLGSRLRQALILVAQTSTQDATSTVNQSFVNSLNVDASTLGGNSASYYATQDQITSILSTIDGLAIEDIDGLSASLANMAVTNADNNFSTDQTFAQNVTITGNLTVNGTQFITNTETVEVEDNLLLINNGEVGSGVTAGLAGIEIDRGASTNYQFVFEEATDLFKVGVAGSLQAVATRPDSPTDGYFAKWNSSGATLDFVDIDSELTNYARTDIAEVFSSSVTASSFIGDGSLVTGVDADRIGGVAFDQLARTDINETFAAGLVVIGDLDFSGTGREISFNGNFLINADASGEADLRARTGYNLVLWGQDSRAIEVGSTVDIIKNTSITGVLSLSQEIVSTKAGEVADLRGANSRINWNPSNAGIRAYIEYIDNTQLNIAAGVGFINMIDNVTVNGDINWTGSSSGNHSGTFGTYGINRFMILDDSPVPTFSNGDVPVYQSADGFFSNLTLATVATTGSYNDLSDQPTFGWTIAADAGSETINSGDTLTITGGLNASTTYTPATNTLEIDFAGASTPTLQQVTTAGSTTTDSITVDDLTASGFVFATEQLYSDRDGEAVQLRGSNARINWNPNNAGLKAYIEYIDNTQLNISAGTGFVNFVENVTVNGTLTATSFSGNGASITNVVAANSSQLGGIDAVNYMRLDSAAGAQNMFNNITFDLGGSEKTITGNASIDISGAIDAGGNLITGSNLLASSGYIKTDAPSDNTTGAVSGGVSSPTAKWWKLGSKHQISTSTFGWNGNVLTVTTEDGDFSIMLADDDTPPS